jgi:hypothetical protein
MAVLVDTCTRMLVEVYDYLGLNKNELRTALNQANGEVQDPTAA